jgi:enoyl-CoA hydratase/carnithine racemase
VLLPSLRTCILELALEIAFKGDVLDARRSLVFGLVSTVVPHEDLLSTAQEWAREIAANASMAVQATKRMMRL